MVDGTLYGNSEHVAQARRKIGLFEEKNPICDCSRSNQIIGQITTIVPDVCTWF